jgi:hypothetical protein
MLRITFIFLFICAQTFANTETVGFIIRDQSELYGDHKLTKVVQFADINKQVIIVHSRYNGESTQKINLNGENFWIHLKDIVIVNYPQYSGSTIIDPDRLGIIKDYLFRLYSN